MGCHKTIPWCWRDELHCSGSLSKGSSQPKTPFKEFAFPACRTELMIGWETDNAGIGVSGCFHVYFIDLFAF